MGTIFRKRISIRQERIAEIEEEEEKKRLKARRKLQSELTVDMALVRKADAKKKAASRQATGKIFDFMPKLAERLSSSFRKATDRAEEIMTQPMTREQAEKPARAPTPQAQQDQNEALKHFTREEYEDWRQRYKSDTGIELSAYPEEFGGVLKEGFIGALFDRVKKEALGEGVGREIGEVGAGLTLGDPSSGFTVPNVIEAGIEGVNKVSGLVGIPEIPQGPFDIERRRKAAEDTPSVLGDPKGFVRGTQKQAREFDVGGLGPADLFDPVNWIPLPVIDPLMGKLLAVSFKAGTKVTLPVARRILPLLTAALKKLPIEQADEGARALRELVEMIRLHPLRGAADDEPLVNMAGMLVPQRFKAKQTPSGFSVDIDGINVLMKRSGTDRVELSIDRGLGTFSGSVPDSQSVTGRQARAMDPRAGQISGIRKLRDFLTEWQLVNPEMRIFAEPANNRLRRIYKAMGLVDTAPLLDDDRIGLLDLPLEILNLDEADIERALENLMGREIVSPRGGPSSLEDVGLARLADDASLSSELSTRPGVNTHTQRRYRSILEEMVSGDARRIDGIEVRKVTRVGADDVSEEVWQVIPGDGGPPTEYPDLQDAAYRVQDLADEVAANIADEQAAPARNLRGSDVEPLRSGEPLTPSLREPTETANPDEIVDAFFGHQLTRGMAIDLEDAINSAYLSGVEGNEVFTEFLTSIQNTNVRELVERLPSEAREQLQRAIVGDMPFSELRDIIARNLRAQEGRNLGPSAEEVSSDLVSGRPLPDPGRGIEGAPSPFEPTVVSRDPPTPDDIASAFYGHNVSQEDREIIVKAIKGVRSRLDSGSMTGLDSDDILEGFYSQLDRHNRHDLVTRLDPGDVGAFNNEIDEALFQSLEGSWTRADLNSYLENSAGRRLDIPGADTLERYDIIVRGFFPEALDNPDLLRVLAREFNEYGGVSADEVGDLVENLKAMGIELKDAGELETLISKRISELDATGRLEDLADEVTEIFPNLRDIIAREGRDLTRPGADILERYGTIVRRFFPEAQNDQDLLRVLARELNEYDGVSADEAGDLVENLRMMGVQIKDVGEPGAFISKRISELDATGRLRDLADQVAEVFPHLRDSRRGPTSRLRANEPEQRLIGPEEVRGHAADTERERLGLDLSEDLEASERRRLREVSTEDVDPGNITRRRIEDQQDALSEADFERRDRSILDRLSDEEGFTRKGAEPRADLTAVGGNQMEAAALTPDGELIIRFPRRAGGTRIYKYTGVPEETFADLTMGDSPGSIFNNRIRNNPDVTFTQITEEEAIELLGQRGARGRGLPIERRPAARSDVAFEDTDGMFTGDADFGGTGGAPVRNTIIPGASTPDRAWRIIQRALFTGENAQDLLRRIAQWKGIDHVPLLRKMVRVVAGPASEAGIDTTWRHAVTYRVMESLQGNELTQAVIGKLDKRIWDVVPGNTGKISVDMHDGLREVEFVEVARAVIENPGQTRYRLGEEQTQWIKDADEIIQILVRQFNEVADEPLVLPANYWPFVRLNEQGNIIASSRMGTIPQPIRDIFAEMGGRLERGVNYADPVTTFTVFAEALQKIARDRKLKNVLLDDGILKAATRASVTTDEVAGQVVAPAFSGTVLSAEDAKKLKSVLGTGAALLKPAETFAAIPRLLVTGLLDWGQFGIQMALTLASNPKAFSQGVRKWMLAVARPEQYKRFLGESPAALRAAKYGVDLGGSELTEAARKGPLARLLKKSKLDFAPRGFDAALASTRIYEFDALADLAIKEGFGEQELYRIGGYVNTKLGTTNVRNLGISATQNQIEGAFVFFSQRYTRSIFGMAAWAMGKGIPARNARESLAKLAIAAAGTFYVLGRAAGLNNKEVAERMNPRSGSKFMSLPIGGNEFGFGSAYRSTIKFMGDLSKKDSWEFDSVGDALANNPFSNYMRSRSSPVTGSLIDFMTGEDFIGQKVSIDDFVSNPMHLLDYASGKFLPLNLEAAFEARGSISEKIAAGLIESTGGRTFKRSAFALLQDVQESAAQEQFNKPYDDLDRVAKAQIGELPEIQSAEKRITREQNRRPEQEQQQFFQQVETDREQFQHEQQEDDAGYINFFVNGEGFGIDPDVYKERLKRRQIELFARREAFAEQLNIEFGKEFSDNNLVDQSIDLYFDVTIEDYEDPVTREINWDGFFEARDQALSRLGQRDKTRVERWLERNDTPLMKQFNRLRDGLAGYYEIPSEDRSARERWRKRNPVQDAALWLLGSVTSVLSGRARTESLRLSREAFGQEVKAPKRDSSSFVKPIKLTRIGIS